MTFFGKAASSYRYATGLRGFLRTPVTLDDARRRLGGAMRERDASFLQVLEHGVYLNRRSPYRRLLEHFGIELGDVRRMVAQDGIERALEQLHDAGVYVTLDEFKGHASIKRNGFELSVTAEDFANPMMQGGVVDKTSSASGSGAPARQASVDFGHIDYECMYLGLLYASHGLLGRPIAMWDASIPVFQLMMEKLGFHMDRIFTTADVRTLGIRSSLVTRGIHSAVGLFGPRLAAAESVPREDVLKVVRYLAEQKAAGHPAIMQCMASPAVRICLTAQEQGIDIAGTAFRTGGEPYTTAKAQAIAAAGAQAVISYVVSEVGSVGHACSEGSSLVDLHFVKEKLAVISKQTSLGAPALIFTNLRATAPRLMLNAESGDYATFEERECGCEFGRLGFTTHMTDVGSYEKLTSEGVTVLGGRLYDLVENVLPVRFGGHVSDYQIVEEEETRGIPKVSVLVAPRVGNVDEEALISLVLDHLKQTHVGGKLMANEWRTGETLRVVRREPYATGTMKVLPLHVIHNTSQAPGSHRD